MSTIRSINIIVGMRVIIFLEGSFIRKNHLLYNIVCSTLVPIIFITINLLNVVAYVWILIVSILYWKSDHFNIHAETINFSPLVPFIG